MVSLSTAPEDLRLGDTTLLLHVSRTTPPPDICKKYSSKNSDKGVMASSFLTCLSQSLNGRRFDDKMPNVRSMKVKASGNGCLMGFSTWNTNCGGLGLSNNSVMTFAARSTGSHERFYDDINQRSF